MPTKKNTEENPLPSGADALYVPDWRRRWSNPAAIPRGTVWISRSLWGPGVIPMPFVGWNVRKKLWNLDDPFRGPGAMIWKHWFLLRKNAEKYALWELSPIPSVRDCSGGA
jgi:hypothetical protein